MHYRPFSFNKNESIPTITTKIPEFNNIIGQYLDFSEMDTLRLNRMYNCCTYMLQEYILYGDIFTLLSLKSWQWIEYNFIRYTFIEYLIASMSKSLLSTKWIKIL